jgi:hypothetical protein
VRVLTLNILATHFGWEQRRSVVRDGIAALDPDLVALQEVVRTDSHDQTLDVLDDEAATVDLDRDGDGIDNEVDGNAPCLASRLRGADPEQSVLRPAPGGTTSGQLVVPRRPA